MCQCWAVFFVLDGSEATLSARPVVPTHMGLRSTSIEVDLKRSYEVGAERGLSRSPLELLLGVDGSAGRDLALCVFAAGLDWTGEEIVDDELRGSDVRSMVRDALDARPEDLLALRQAATAWLGPEDVDQAALWAGRDHLARLMAGVEMVPLVREKTGKLVAAYKSADLFALAAVEITLRLTLDEAMNRCAHCGCLFLAVERSDERYCRRAAPGEPVGGRGCQEIGPRRRYEAAHVDDLRAVYRRAYKRLDVRSRRGHLGREAVAQWRQRARSLIQQAEAEEWDVQRFEHELLSIEPKGA